MVGQRELTVAEELATLKIEMKFLTQHVTILEAECKELKEECEKLKAWKAMCTTTAAAWGVFLVGIATIFGTIASYWPSLASLYNRLKP